MDESSTCGFKVARVAVLEHACGQLGGPCLNSHAVTDLAMALQFSVQVAA